MNDTTMTMIGTLVEDPSLKFTASGVAVCGFRIASTPRKFDKDTNQWVDQKDATLFLSCNIWRDAAERVAESLVRGDRVIVVGKLRQRTYETREGEKRTAYELEVDEVGPSLKWANAKPQKMQRGGNGGQPQGGTRQQPGAGTNDPWASRGAGRPDSFSDSEPPF